MQAPSTDQFSSTIYPRYFCTPGTCINRSNHRFFIDETDLGPVLFLLINYQVQIWKYFKIRELSTPISCGKKSNEITTSSSNLKPLKGPSIIERQLYDLSIFSESCLIYQKPVLLPFFNSSVWWLRAQGTSLITREGLLSIPVLVWYTGEGLVWKLVARALPVWFELRRYQHELVVTWGNTSLVPVSYQSQDHVHTHLIPVKNPSRTRLVWKFFLSTQYQYPLVYYTNTGLFPIIAQRWEKETREKEEERESNCDWWFASLLVLVSFFFCVFCYHSNIKWKEKNQYFT